MNKQEKQYAVARIDSIAAVKIGAIVDKHTTPGVSLTDAQRLQAFKAGKYKVKSEVSRITHYSDIVDIVDFTDEKPEKVDRDKVEADSAKITKEAIRIKDQLMLGDATEALKLIEAFAK